MTMNNPMIAEIRLIMRKLGFAVTESTIRDHQISVPAVALSEWRAYQARYVKALSEGQAANPTGVIL
jgi:hypothetical protein